MRPPTNSHFAPFCKERRMVSLFLSQCPNLIGEAQSRNKILKLVNAFQALNTFTLNNVPVWYLLAILDSLFGSHFWSTHTTGFTLHLCQLFSHEQPLFLYYPYHCPFIIAHFAETQFGYFTMSLLTVWYDKKQLTVSRKSLEKRTLPREYIMMSQSQSTRSGTPQAQPIIILAIT